MGCETSLPGFESCHYLSVYLYLTFYFSHLKSKKNLKLKKIKKLEKKFKKWRKVFKISPLYPSHDWNFVMVSFSVFCSLCLFLQDFNYEHNMFI
jgi:hypothetical protein